MLLENVVELFDADKLNEELDRYADTITICEDVTINPINDKASAKQLMDLMGDAILRFTAARKGMGIVNKLKNPAERKKHASKVMSNINKLRGLMNRLDKAITKANGGKKPVNEAVKKNSAGFKNFEKMAQAVWTASGLEQKKKAMNNMIDAFKAKAKQSKFRQALEKESKLDRIDSMAANILHAGHGDAVVA